MSVFTAVQLWVMRAQELELWVREVVDAVLAGQPVEDSRVELKATWIEPDKAARRLGGHANDSRGEPMLWIIGVDERNRKVTGVDPLEFESWFKQVQRCFDGMAPQLIRHVNVRVGAETVVGLYFETEQYAPFLVKNPEGGYPQFTMPWREGTSTRAARREDVLRVLLPIVKLPDIELQVAMLTMAPTRNNDGEQQQWSFEGFLYITPTDRERVVIPQLDCSVTMSIEGYQGGAVGMYTTFYPVTAEQHSQIISPPLKVMGDYEIKFMPPKPRTSLTVRCSDTELLVEGPGSARIVSNMTVFKPEPVPNEKAHVVMSIKPSGAKRPIVIERFLHPAPAKQGETIRRWVSVEGLLNRGR